MAIKPILFNTQMVRANLEGRKTCTRRIAKPQWKECPNCRYVHNEYIYDNLTDNIYCARCGYPLAPVINALYKPGDILYVRETWCEVGKDTEENVGFLPGTRYLYKADDLGLEHIKRWHPSIHMPKEAARIWLKVTDVRVERLQECGKGWCWDIVKEGIVTPKDPIFYIDDKEFHEALRYEFKKLWNSTIKKSDIDRYGWDANPWVWVIEFERCKKPEGV